MIAFGWRRCDLLFFFPYIPFDLIHNTEQASDRKQRFWRLAMTFTCLGSWQSNYKLLQSDYDRHFNLFKYIKIQKTALEKCVYGKWHKRLSYGHRMMNSNRDWLYAIVVLRESFSHWLKFYTDFCVSCSYTTGVSVFSLLFSTNPRRRVQPNGVRLAYNFLWRNNDWSDRFDNLAQMNSAVS